MIKIILIKQGVIGVILTAYDLLLIKQFYLLIGQPYPKLKFLLYHWMLYTLHLSRIAVTYFNILEVIWERKTISRSTWILYINSASINKHMQHSACWSKLSYIFIIFFYISYLFLGIFTYHDPRSTKRFVFMCSWSVKIPTFCQPGIMINEIANTFDNIDIVTNMDK